MSTENETQQLAEELRKMVSHLVRNVRVSTATVRTSQYETLDLLDSHDALSIADLARLRGVKHQSMRLVINELEAQDLVLRQKSAQDARAQVIVLSDQARAALAAARQQRADWLAARINETLDQQDRDDLQKGLAALRKLL
ncbi:MULTISPECIES: MarR family winged helix-turn-helix transcriptional regulator [Pantoea]|uniref:Transcriptional regulator n=1 Tax=Pantoea endophytica TaxID=92488 RepID=A0ABX4SWR1_9GAMM|nr:MULTISPECIES: MarR family transcriptional regulator [Pantoea]MBD9660987.1 MarR family transcriptional regulator [Pantoea sp. PNT03]MDR6349144.1 DNA-binding MarR family transcriptional regulator [Pantoea sp. SORGH_AS_0659]PLR25360.1 transcriptional regulator [Pantoea endophytica]QCP60767.1 MarR family transcriptional regulator [Pantoea sp. SO10]